MPATRAGMTGGVRGACYYFAAFSASSMIFGNAAAFMLARSLGDKRDAAVDFLFAQQKNWAFTETPFESLANMVKQIGIGQEKFEETLKDEKLQKAVYAVAEQGQKFGVNATPTFFINGVKFDGRMDVAGLPKIIDDAEKAAK